MAKAAPRSITRRSMVAGSAAVPAAVLAAGLPGTAEAEVRVGIGQAADAHPTDADPVHAAIEAHARAYAVYDAQTKAEFPDDDIMERLVEVEREAAETFAATVPTTLAGAAAALAHVRELHARDDYPMLDDYWCYVFIASIEMAVRRAIEGRSTV